MEARNSFGRKISLLNESEAERPTIRLPSFPHPQSRTCSNASTPSNSPSVPPLVRSDSADSGTMQTPSPITPTFPFDGYSQMPQKHSDVGFAPSHSFFSVAKESGSIYPPIPQQSAPTFAYPAPVSASPPTGFYRTSLSPGSENPHSAAAKPPQKKNSYPCPMAKQFNCNDHFTTSGHAARHAKKHTGKKDAFCPECNKAFTRKDNMEQHRRTHQNGRNAGRSSANADGRKTKKQQQRPKPAPLQASLPVLDPSLPVSPASSFGFGDSLAPAVQPVHQYPQEITSGSSYDQMPYPVAARYESLPHSFTNGLDTLAIAATGEDRKRKYQE